jgi:hypothetical protein
MFNDYIIHVIQVLLAILIVFQCHDLFWCKIFDTNNTQIPNQSFDFNSFNPNKFFLMQKILKKIVKYGKRQM